MSVTMLLVGPGDFVIPQLRGWFGRVTSNCGAA
jgi:hypothetical protein